MHRDESRRGTHECVRHKARLCLRHWGSSAGDFQGYLRDHVDDEDYEGEFGYREKSR